jgi:type IV pilus assembly protein PilC
MLRAGLALTRALSVSERQTTNVSLKGILGSVQEDIQKGKPFHESLKAYPKAFSRLYVSMVRAGEEGGTLAEALQTISLQLERSSTLRKKIRGAMIYPIIVVLAMVTIGILMMIYVVPTLSATFKELNVPLPLTTQIIVGLSDFLSTHTILALGSVIGTITGFVAVYRTSFGRVAVEWTLMRLPIIGNLVKETNAARTARTLSSLLRSGVDVVAAFSITGDVIQNTFYKKVIADAAAHVEKGKPMSEDFMHNTHLYPVLVGEMIAVGEETGQISQMLEEVANFYELEVERKTKDLSTVIEPILMLVIGAAVGFFALAMISPIYSISDSIG